VAASAPTQRNEMCGVGILLACQDGSEREKDLMRSAVCSWFLAGGGWGGRLFSPEQRYAVPPRRASKRKSGQTQGRSGGGVDPTIERASPGHLKLLVRWRLAAKWRISGSFVIKRQTDGVAGPDPYPNEDEFAPAWSPDGHRLAFVKHTGRSLDVFLMSADGTKVTNLTHTPRSYEIHPSWSPDGHRLAFVKNTTKPPICL